MLRDREVRDGHVIDEIQLGLQRFVLLLTEHVRLLLLLTAPLFPQSKEQLWKATQRGKGDSEISLGAMSPEAFWFLVEAQLNCARGFLIDVRWESRVSVGLLSLAPASF